MIEGLSTEPGNHHPSEKEGPGTNMGSFRGLCFPISLFLLTGGPDNPANFPFGGRDASRGVLLGLSSSGES